MPGNDLLLTSTKGNGNPSVNMLMNVTYLSFLQLLMWFLLSFSICSKTGFPLRVYLAAIVAHQPAATDTSILFRHPMVKTLFKGLLNIHPPHHNPAPHWSLSVVLNQLTKPPFEPMATCSEKMFTLKTSFLVAITSARRALELAALHLSFRSTCRSTFSSFPPSKGHPPYRYFFPP